MNIDEYIKELKEKFPSITETDIFNTKRLMVNIPKEALLELTYYFFNYLEYRYQIVTAMDSKDGYEVIYHYSDDKTGWIMNINVLLPHDNPEVESITPVVYGAEWIEREIMDLLGIKILNHPKPERFLMAESWPEGEYPLRRKYHKEDR
jgi:NADH-quinone oxidoreductase subunit C